MSKYQYYDGHTAHKIKADSLKEARAYLIRLFDRPRYAIYKDGKKAGTLIWDTDDTGKIYWMTPSSEKKGLFGLMTIKKKSVKYEVSVNGELGGRVND